MRGMATEFARSLREAMEAASLTAAALAQRAGLTEAAISYYLSGRRQPSYPSLRKLAVALPSIAPTPHADERSRMHTIEEAIAEVRAGRMVVVLDDEDRENEGDLIMAAQMVTPEAVNFMRKEAGGLICVPMIGKRLDELQIPAMVHDNTSLHETAFTVSVEARGRTTTGISAHDRAATIQALLDPHAKSSDFLRPGHTFPLRAREGGVLVRAAHTETAVDLARLAGFYPAGVVCEIMNEDGSMARLPQLEVFAEQHNLKIITVKDLIAYRMRNEKLVHRIAEFDLPTTFGRFRGVAYETAIDEVCHVAMVMGEVGDGKDMLVRVHSECLTGDALHSMRCDCAVNRDAALSMIAKEGRGVLLYLHQEGRGIGLANKLRAYALQDQGMDTVEANRALGFPDDKRDYGLGSQMLADLGIKTMRIISNNPRKIHGLGGYGLEIVDRVPLKTEPTAFNARYLETKRDKLGHLLDEYNQPAQSEGAR